MMIARWTTAVVVAASITGLATPAQAQTASGHDAKGLGNRHQLIVSADRLVPAFSYERVSIEEDVPNGTRTTSTSGAGGMLLLGSPLRRLTPHTLPRAAVDFTVIDRLTIGGFIALGFGFGGDRSVEIVTPGAQTKTSFDTGSGVAFGFGPRVGYILPLTENLAFWPRGGLSVYKFTVNNDDDNNNVRRRISSSETNVSLDLDPQLAIVPLEHFFFHAGPVLNIPIAGSTSTTIESGATTTTVSNDLSSLHFGITAGLGGWFNL